MSHALSKPAGETRLFVVPMGFPPPVSIGDRLPNGLTVCQFSDRFVVGNKSFWRFFVQKTKEEEPTLMMA